MSKILSRIRRWTAWLSLAALLPMGACSDELPLPQGVNPHATPRIIVKKERIEINGQSLSLGVRGEKVVAPWELALGDGHSLSDSDNRFWTQFGLVLKVFDGPPVSSSFDIFLRRGEYYSGNHGLPGSASEAPPKSFPGYLEIDGIPIGPQMRLAEMQRWRKKLGLPALRKSRLIGEYVASEQGRYSQFYYFDSDGFVAWIQLL